MAKYEDDLENLENWMRRLKIEYDIFFNGNRKRPPDDLKMRVEKLVSRLSEASDMTFSQRFRYSALVTRFYVYRDLWRRTQMDREGNPAFARRPVPRPLPAPEAPPSKPPEGLSVSIPVSGGDPGLVRSLFETLAALNARQSTGSPKMTLERFSDFIDARTRDLQQKYSCRSVRFSVSVEDDSIRLTAKPEM